MFYKPKRMCIDFIRTVGRMVMSPAFNRRSQEQRGFDSYTVHSLNELAQIGQEIGMYDVTSHFYDQTTGLFINPLVK